jgi:hypothetical protein
MSTLMFTFCRKDVLSIRSNGINWYTGAFMSILYIYSILVRNENPGYLFLNIRVCARPSRH